MPWSSRPSAIGSIKSFPILGKLHHHYALDLDFWYTRGAKHREASSGHVDASLACQAIAERVTPALRLAWRYTRHRAIGSQP